MNLPESTGLESADASTRQCPELAADQAVGPPRPRQIAAILAAGETAELGPTEQPAIRLDIVFGWSLQPGEEPGFDAACTLYDDEKSVVETVWSLSRKVARGAVRWGKLTALPSLNGDRQVIDVDLGALPPNVRTLVFTLNSPRGHPLNPARDISCRFAEHGTGRVLARVGVPRSESHTGAVLCKVQREQSAWVVTAIAEFHDGKTVRAMVGPARLYL